ncbi:MAG TPA: cytochrome c3 family protein, partial [Bacillota bacterium]|nr:cytochrome c3 family protein [Bacillota bacterium]
MKKTTQWIYKYLAGWVRLICLVLFALYPVGLATAVDGGPVIQDLAAPRLLRAEPTSKQVLYLTFSEPIIDPGVPAGEGGQVSISGGLFGSGTVVNQVYLTGDSRVLRLILPGGQEAGNLPGPITYSAKVEGIKDIYDNTLVSASITFDAFTPHGKYAPPPNAEGKIPAGNATVLCGQCHSVHQAKGKGLLGSDTISQACFVCHGTIGISAYRVEEEFRSRGGDTGSVSLHKALDEQDKNFLSCTSCHNPHGDWKDDGTGLYPKLLCASDSGGKYASGTQFCLACHGAEDKKFEELLDESNNITRPSYYVTTGGNHINPLHPQENNGLDSEGPVHYDNSAAAGFPQALNPPSGTQVTCVRCHERHGSQFTSLLDNSAANGEEELCFKCHGREANFSRSGINICQLFAKTSRHQITSTLKGKVE